MNKSRELRDQIIDAFEKNKNEEQRPSMEAYMKNHFSFYGIKTPERKAMLAPILKEHRLSETERLETVRLLFQEEFRECQYAGLALLEKDRKQVALSTIGFYKELLVTAPWWDTVDMIASRLCGNYFKIYPDMLKPITEEWRRSPDKWVRRSSMLHQLSYKETTDQALLFDTALHLKDERDFFIEKAIGWALREYSKTDAAGVAAFVQNHEWRPLTRREALKWMKSKGILQR
ncbi:hypothetical protein EQV77_05675 [Halobacillus fulvus]|nr:hypothetical protein EQV77_05675 [Halobacillus fulvus]